MSVKVTEPSFCSWLPRTADRIRLSPLWIHSAVSPGALYEMSVSAQATLVVRSLITMLHIPGDCLINDRLHVITR